MLPVESIRIMKDLLRPRGLLESCTKECSKATVEWCGHCVSDYAGGDASCLNNVRL